MKSKMLRKFTKNQKYQILSVIKRSQGMSVSEICKIVRLSYMGVKQHCVTLEDEGLLDTWRRPKSMGRPEKAYRLTTNAQELFPNESTDFTCDILRCVDQVYGPAAPEKILHQIYKNRTQQLRGQMRGHTLEERVRSLAALREAQGCMAEYYYNPDVRRHQIIEYNSPVLQIGDLYPILFDMEKQMIEELLDAQVEREVERVSGLYRCVFTITPDA